MPGMNGQGPAGQGPGTGKGLGPCGRGKGRAETQDVSPSQARMQGRCGGRGRCGAGQGRQGRGGWSDGAVERTGGTLTRTDREEI